MVAAVGSAQNINFDVDVDIVKIPFTVRLFGMVTKPVVSIDIFALGEFAYESVC